MLKNFLLKIKRNAYPIIGFIVVFTLIIILAVYFATNLVSQSNEKFVQKGQDISSQVENNFNIYENFFRDVQGFFAGSQNVARDEFTNFISEGKFLERYPAVTSIGFTRKVTREDKQAFVDSLNNDPIINPDGGLKYKITPEADKDVYFASDYAEPYDIKTTQFGFDVSSSPERFAIINQAIDTGEPAMTQRIALLGKYTGEYGFIIYLPVYKNGLPHSTVEERQANTLGIISAAFRLNNVFDQIIQDKSAFSDLSLKIYTDGQTTDDLKIFDSQTILTESNSNFSNTIDKTIAGRKWDFVYSTRVGYGLSNTEKVIPIITIILGTFLALLAAAYVRYLRNSQRQAVESAQVIKVKLDESEARLNSILESVDIIAYAINTNGVFTLSSGKGLEDLGLKQHELEGKSVFEVYKDNPIVVDQIKRAIKGEVIKETVPVGAVTLESRITPIFDRDGKVVSIVGISNNITESEAANVKLKAKTDELERLNKMMINRELKMKELKDQLAKQS